ncbi:molybdenum cofactor biosynthesis protein B [Parashewanella tropica]|uniref:molybdenum cofactor biosynthesis protein B n=1 Tax=Parashewanella tropica TaxID=2547970 RepID=UPI00105A60CC|nr:molybdenum cofactor biosynthesis protein B [Parashewanella tropica]
MAKCTTKEFVPLGVAVLTVSDRHTFDSDTSGSDLNTALTETGHHCVERQISKDCIHHIRAIVSQWIVNNEIHAIIINGGTGFTEGDNTPAAVSVLFDRPMEGFGELFRQLSFDDIGTSCVQSRAIGGLANRTAIFCLPGSPGACRLGWEQIIKPQLDARTRPCNFVGHLLKGKQ